MINDLLTFRRSLESWGLVVPKNYHPNINKNAATGEGYLVSISDKGIESVAPFKDYLSLYHFKENNFKKVPTFKFANDPNGLKNLANACATNLSFVPQLAARVGTTNDKLRLLSVLAQRLENIDAGKFASDLIQYFQSIEKHGPVYICLDVHDQPGLQTIEFVNALNDRLFELQADDSGEELDALGNPLEGYEKMFPKIQIGQPIGEFPIYSRNQDNNCYARYGLNSIHAARLGNKSRAELSDLAQFAFSKDREARLDREGTWFRYTIGKSTDRTNREYLVLTSLFPASQRLEIGVRKIKPEVEGEKKKKSKKIVKDVESSEEDIDSDNWEFELQKMVQAMRHQSESCPNAFGHVLVLRTLKGAWQVVSSQSHTLEKISVQVERWIEGIHNGSTYVPSGRMVQPSIYGFANNLNKWWKQGDGEMRSETLKVLDIGTVYDFFFDDPMAVKIVLNLFATRAVPMLLKIVALDRTPFAANILVPMRNLILHKLGYAYDRKEHTMDHWGFCLGELFRESNFLYRKFFQSRNSSVPSTLIGQKYVESAYRSPRTAYSRFIVNFASCIKYCESHGIYVHRFRELNTKLMTLSGGDLPANPSSEDVMMICAGYMNYVPRTKTESSEQPTEPVSS